MSSIPWPLRQRQAGENSAATDRRARSACGADKDDPGHRARHAPARWSGLALRGWGARRGRNALMASRGAAVRGSRLVFERCSPVSTAAAAPAAAVPAAAAVSTAATALSAAAALSAAGALSAAAAAAVSAAGALSAAAGAPAATVPGAVSARAALPARAAAAALSSTDAGALRLADAGVVRSALHPPLSSISRLRGVDTAEVQVMAYLYGRYWLCLAGGGLRRIWIDRPRQGERSGHRRHPRRSVSARRSRWASTRGTITRSSIAACRRPSPRGCSSGASKAWPSTASSGS